MTVVLIVAILGAIALPTYKDQARRGQIQDGTSVLSDSQVRMEQFFQDNKTYVGAALARSQRPISLMATAARRRTHGLQDHRHGSG